MVSAIIVRLLQFEHANYAELTQFFGAAVKLNSRETLNMQKYNYVAIQYTVHIIIALIYKKTTP